MTKTKAIILGCCILGLGLKSLKSQSNQNANGNLSIFKYVNNDSTDANYHLANGIDTVLIANEMKAVKGRVVRRIKDFPELHKMVKSNYYKDISFVISVVICYNDYKNAAIKPVINDEYFRKYLIISKKESRKGPTKEMLKVKQPLYSKIKFSSLTTTRKNITTLSSTSTYGEKFDAKFTYGNSAYYSTGFMLKNLKRVMKDDKEALKYIKKYRTMTIGKNLFNFLSLAILGAAIASISDSPPFGLTDDFTPFLAVPGAIIFISQIYRPAKWKAKYINNAINIYNKNLVKE